MIIDRAAATASWGEPSSPTNAQSLSLGLLFSKAVSELTGSDLSNEGTATGCSFSITTISSSHFTVTTAGCSEGTVQLSLAANSVSSASGVNSPAATLTSDAVTIDRTAPTASWTAVPASPASSSSASYTLTFSENVSGLSAADFSNTGNASDCLASPDQSSGKVFTVSVSDCSVGSLTLRLAAGSVTDLAGNQGPASAVSASSVIILLIPEASSAPTVSGLAQVGEILSASAGEWTRSPDSYSYQWQTSPDVDVWSNISGETSSSLSLGQTQAGSYIRIKVSATNSSGTGVAYSTQAGPVGQPPSSSVAPGISGSSMIGSTLTVSSGSWAGSPAPSLSYQWQLCSPDSDSCSDIEGETSSSYVSSSADNGFRVRALVSAVNAYGSASAYSDFSEVISENPPSAPSLTSAISVTSSPSAGAEATTDGGTWSGYPEPTIEYQWQLCVIGGECQDITSTSASIESMQLEGIAKSFTPTRTHAGIQLRVRVTATNSEGSASEVSVKSAPVKARPLLSTAVSLSGAAASGAMLIAQPGVWSGYPTPAFTYQWKLCSSSSCADLGSPSSSAGFRSQPVHVSKRMRVLITATNSLGSESTLSDYSDVIQGVPLNSALPSFSGSAAAGQTLTASPGTWQSIPDASYSYQWQRCDSSGNRCASVAGAASADYLLQAGDAGQRFRIRVVASNSRGATTAYSAISPQITSSVSMTSGPVVSGLAIAGKPLAAFAGKWSGFPAPTVTYQWQKCQADGSGCSNLSATGSSYSLLSADRGSRIRVRIIAANTYSTLTAYSSLSAVVGSAPVLSEDPEIVGEAKLGETLQVDAGQWDSATTPEFVYQWQKCKADGSSCSDIRRANDSQMVVTPSQVSASLRVKVTSSNPLGSASAATDPTEAIEGAPVSVTAPSVKGQEQTRGNLSSTAGSWVALPAASLSYQWQRCRGIECQNIADASTENYQATRADVGYRLRTQVTATNSLGAATTASAMSGQIKIALFTLTVEAEQGGKVRVLHNGVSCQGVCKMLVPEGTMVRLRPETAAGYVPQGFSGDCSAEGDCDFEMTSSKAVKALFAPSPKLSLSYAISNESIFLYGTTTVNLTAKVIAPTEVIRDQAGVQACLTLPETMTVPTLPEGSTLIGSRLCWSLGTATPPYERQLTVVLKAKNRTGQKPISPYITALNREVVPGKPTSGTGLIRVSVKR